MKRLVGACRHARRDALANSRTEGGLGNQDGIGQKSDIEAIGRLDFAMKNDGVVVLRWLATRLFCRAFGR